LSEGVHTESIPTSVANAPLYVQESYLRRGCQGHSQRCEPVNIRYTLCFIRRGDEILMLLRNNPPNQGLYNGVGGKIEPGELPLASVLREVREETGITLTTARFGGIVTWSEDDGDFCGMYVYVGELPPYAYAPHRNGQDTAEGLLMWLREVDVVNPCTDETGVVSNIPHFLKPMLAGDRPKEYRCVYDGDGLFDGMQMYAMSARTIAHATATE
jgi:8-oxo-dGTP diphosphatase